MRLIDADALLSDIERTIEESGCVNHEGEIMDCIRYAPEVDTVPVVRGEWKMDTDPDDGDCRCSSCKVCIDALHKRNHGLLNALGFKLHTFYKYCPNCGAKMESEGST